MTRPIAVSVCQDGQDSLLYLFLTNVENKDNCDMNKQRFQDTTTA